MSTPIASSTSSRCWHSAFRTRRSRPRKDALDKFKQGKFTFGADASAVVVKAGAAAKAVWSGDVAAFTRGQKGALLHDHTQGRV